MQASWEAVFQRFDSTYEGLKPFGEPLSVGPEEGFDSTYEGLKRGAWSFPQGLEARFDSTYEGLKPRIDVELRVSLGPFRQYL